MASERGPDGRRKRRGKPASKKRVEQAEAATAARIDELKRRPTTQPHGTRARYMHGCRCVPCRAANSRYECRRQLERLKGRANGCTSTEQVQQHLLRLSRQGIGYKQVAKAARVNPGALQQVRLGLRKQMRAQSVARVLAVGAEARAPGALVPAGPTLRRIEWLLKEGFTQTALARMLGSKAKQPTLQIGRDWVEAGTAAKVEAAAGTMPQAPDGSKRGEAGMNKALMLKIADRIEQHPERFDQLDYGDGQAVRSEASQSARRRRASAAGRLSCPGGATHFTRPRIHPGGSGRRPDPRWTSRRPKPAGSSTKPGPHGG